MKPWKHAVLYQLTWFVTVLAGTRVAVLWAMPLGWLLLYRTPRAGRWFILITALLGFGTDLLLQSVGLIRFHENTLIGPLWLLVLWFGFAGVVWHLLYRVPFAWLQAACGAVSGPLSYASGALLGAATPLATEGLVAYAVFWSIAFPVLIRIRHRLTPTDDLIPAEIHYDYAD